MVESGNSQLDVGTEITFGLGYGALLRAMTSPFVSKAMNGVPFMWTADDVDRTIGTMMSSSIPLSNKGDNRDRHNFDSVSD